MWFKGTHEQYAQVLETGARAVRDANPEAVVLRGPDGPR